MSGLILAAVILWVVCGLLLPAWPLMLMLLAGVISEAEYWRAWRLWAVLSGPIFAAVLFVLWLAGLA
jgi:hypothetical protein